MKAIQTFYKGFYFRSRLEARWAVFFDSLGIPWEYEHEGFERGEDKYLPDFYLPETSIRGYGEKGCWVEIKPKSFNIQDFKAGDWFGNLILFKGDPMDGNTWATSDDEGGTEFIGKKDCMDYPLLFWICAKCHFTKIEFPDMNNACCDKCGGYCDKNMLFKSAEKARQARFEYGQKS
jgi:hypothetical protein